MQCCLFGLQEGRDKQFLVKQIAKLSGQLQIPKHNERVQDWHYHMDNVLCLRLSLLP